MKLAFTSMFAIAVLIGSSAFAVEKVDPAKLSCDEILRLQAETRQTYLSKVFFGMNRKKGWNGPTNLEAEEIKQNVLEPIRAKAEICSRRDAPAKFVSQSTSLTTALEAKTKGKDLAAADRFRLPLDPEKFDCAEITSVMNEAIAARDRYEKATSKLETDFYDRQRAAQMQDTVDVEIVWRIQSKFKKCEQAATKEATSVPTAQTAQVRR